jgi:hypothetical protein
MCHLERAAVGIQDIFTKDVDTLINLHGVLKGSVEAFKDSGHKNTGDKMLRDQLMKKGKPVYLITYLPDYPIPEKGLLLHE